MHFSLLFYFFIYLKPPGVVVTESQTFKKRSDFQSNDDYAVYIRENIQVSGFECSLLSPIHLVLSGEVQSSFSSVFRS